MKYSRTGILVLALLFAGCDEAGGKIAGGDSSVAQDTNTTSEDSTPTGADTGSEPDSTASLDTTQTGTDTTQTGTDTTQTGTDTGSDDTSETDTTVESDTSSPPDIEQDAGPPGEVTTCTLNEQLPSGTCVPAGTLEFGWVVFGQTATRLFRVDNETRFDATITSLGLAHSAFAAVAFTLDSGGARTDTSLPTVLAPGAQLHVEVTLTARNLPRPLVREFPVNVVDVAYSVSATPGSLAVPVTGFAVDPATDLPYPPQSCPNPPNNLTHQRNVGLYTSNNSSSYTTGISYEEVMGSPWPNARGVTHLLIPEDHYLSIPVHAVSPQTLKAGAAFYGWDFSYVGNIRGGDATLLTLSKCPGDFDTAQLGNCWMRGGTESGAMVAYVDPLGTVNPTYCKLDENEIYYINIVNALPGDIETTLCFDDQTPPTCAVTCFARGIFPN